MILNKSGTIIISTVILMSITLIFTPDILDLKLQTAFFFLILIFSFCLDGSPEKGFLVLVAMILSYSPLHLEEDNYLLFLVSIPLFSRIGVFLDTLNTAIFIAITSKIIGKIEERKYIDYI